jgi:hypothetical protein
MTEKSNIVKFPGRQSRRSANLRLALNYKSGFEFMDRVAALPPSERDGLAWKLRRIADYLDAMDGAS